MLKLGCHISPTAGSLSSAIQFLHRWIRVTWGYHRHHKGIQVCERTGGNSGCKTVLANSYLSRRSLCGVINPPAGIPRIPGYCSLRGLRGPETSGPSPQSPAPIPHPAPVNGPGQCVFFFTPCRCPRLCHRPIQCPGQPPVNEFSPPRALLLRILPSRTILF